MTRTEALRLRSWGLGGLTIAAAAYLVLLLSQYYFPPHLPRRRLESVFFVLIALGIATVFARRTAGARPEGLARISAELGRPAGGAAALSIATALTGLALVIYGGALGIGFLSDDFIVADFARRHVWVYGTDAAFARPVVPLLWAALEYVPAPFDRVVHATNILLHALNGSLVVLVAARMGLSRIQGIAAGVLFVASPALTEGVVWTTGVHDVLMATFCMIAAVAVTFAERSIGWSIVAVASGVLALGVKETGVIAPALAVLVLWASGTVRTGHRTVRTLAALAAVAIVYTAFRLTVGIPATYGEDIARIYFVKQLVVGPFAALGAPWTVAWVQAHPVAGFIRSTLLVALVAGCLIVWRRDELDFRRAAACAAWTLVGILPVFSLFYIGPSLEGSRYLYLSAGGFSLLLSVLAGRLASTLPRSIAGPAFVAVLAAVVIPVIPAFRHEIVRWTEAARVRDAILARAQHDSSLALCGSFVAEGLMDNVDGAFVFHNGFIQALSFVHGEDIPISRGTGKPDRVCRVRWNGVDVIVMPD